MGDGVRGMCTRYVCDVCVYVVMCMCMWITHKVTHSALAIDDND